MTCDSACAENCLTRSYIFLLSTDDDKLEKLLLDHNNRKVYLLGDDVVDAIRRARPYNNGNATLRGLLTLTYSTYTR